MSSIPGLPTQGSNVTILITRVHLNPLCVLVEFWGKFSQDKTTYYERLAEDIQSPRNTFQDLEGHPGDQCLVQIDGIWYRARIVSINGLKYTVFLIDKGMTCSATTSMLAWGKKEHFHLPPEVEFCVLANVLPLSLENRWSPMALEFLKSLSGKTVAAHVQDVLVPHRTFLLNMPYISKQMYEMGFAKKISPDKFQNSVLVSLQTPGGADQIQPLSMAAGDRQLKQELFFPELPGGTVETVIVTEVTNPQRIFCQLKVFSQELKKLSEQITQSCEGRTSKCIISADMIGFPCAARGSDGKWYRSVLQQVFPANKIVEVLNVDYGTKQFVQVENVRTLAAEFFRMPVVTYICSLHGIIDKGVGWTTNQIDYLRSLLLYKTVIAKFEYQSISEGVHYVTLYWDDNINMNNLFGSKENCLLECEKTLGDYAIRSTASSRQHPAQQQRTDRNMLPPGQAVKEKDKKAAAAAEKFPAEDLSPTSSHVAFVKDASDPSEFWIQTQNYTKELSELMASMHHLYKDSASKDAVKNPTVGLYCAARAEDSDFYRATVAEVEETQLKVFFVDYGNTEVVDRSNIRTLPAELKKLPRLALKCTLAGVKPKDGRWSQSASELFINTVTDKELNVHVTAKYEDGYVVQLTDREAQGEQDVGTLMCSSGLAERAEIEKQAKATVQTAYTSPSQHPDVVFPSVFRNSGMFFQSQNPAGLASNERKVSTFREHMFPIGSILDVSVSYIKSPNDFWCQLAQQAGHLKSLMHDIQAHYANSEYQPNVETACVARHPENRMWYRALVIHKHETPLVDVLFVDYGQTETVSLFDLRRICPEFLTLHGQAFRCSLLNPIDPTSAINEWNEEAVARFHNFVDIAASSFVILKCTIYAVMYSDQKVVFNIVELETPFESICTSMVNLVKSAPPKKAARPSFRLDTYYYSTHNVKTGTEERITVTCVNGVGKFYCQLEKNINVMKDLMVKVNDLCHQLQNAKLPRVFGTLCFAKYTDGQWYRGQIKATKPAIVVHFVDYGDTIEVEKSDLLPVPREANDIMSVPVQALVCGLSDIPVDVPSEVNTWFEIHATESSFQALVVAREHDGKLLVELYRRHAQLNAKIKKRFHIEMNSTDQVVCQGRKTLPSTANPTPKTPKAVPTPATDTDDHTQALKKNDLAVPSPPRPKRPVSEIGQKVKMAAIELYKPPHQRCGRTPSNVSEPRKENLPQDPKLLNKSESSGTESQKESEAGKNPKLTDLPSKSITCGMTADVYVSHCNSPASFYVQFVSEENNIFSLVEKLNDPESNPNTSDITDVQPGDLVKAEFTNDSSSYRAVVREIHGNTTALVEFVDFGNAESTPISKIGRLQESFLQFPAYSTHCMLSDAAVVGSEGALDPELLSAFKEDIGGCGERVLKCQFNRQVGPVWEVSLKDNDVNVVCRVATKCPEITAEKVEQAKEEPAQTSDTDSIERPRLNTCLLRYSLQDLLEDQLVYITTINEDHTFWCQPANSEELDKILSSISEVEDHGCMEPGALLPGTPCFAFFSDDQLWHRAEVVDKDGDELSVLFVDYGNEAQVNITEVREMPRPLLEIPPQAFLCGLVGFDTTCGSWDSSATHELSKLTTDKLLQLTVVEETVAEGKIKWVVRLQCEGQEINEGMKICWKCFTEEDEPDAVGLTAESETQLQEDSAEDEDQPEQPAVCVHPERGHVEEHGGDDPADSRTADDVPDLANSPESSERSEDLVHSESSVTSPKDECVSVEKGNIVPITAMCPKNILPSNSGVDETTAPSFNNKDDSHVSALSCNMNVEAGEGIEEESASVVDTVGSHDVNSTSDENLEEAVDESKTITTDEESLPEEENTSCSSSDIMNVSDPAKETDDGEVSVAMVTPLTRTTAVRMVQADLVLPALPLCDVPTWEDTEARDDFTQEEVPCVTKQMERGQKTATHFDHTATQLSLHQR
ncbi:tudor domain-containing 6 [Brachyistius frenatus]|uniref:tudor domain-containing 6 n=1 Tax=Brachyistius frenatus TaxID=100188 RepID=UPI0037E7856B